MSNIRPVGGRTVEFFAACFCLVWFLTLLAFPHLKGAPSGYLPVFLGIGLAIAADRRGWLNRFADRSAATVPALQPQPIGAGKYLSAVLISTVLVRIAAVLVFPLEPRMDDEQFHRYAVNMLGGEGYGAPGHRAFFPPGMSFVLTGWYWLVGPSVLAGKLLQVVFSVLLVWQTWATARLYLPEGQARLAGWLVALMPTLVFYTATLGYEILLGLIFVLVCRLASPGSEPAGDRWLVRILTIGLLLGFGTLIKPVCLLVPAVLAAGWWLQGTHIWRVVLRAAGVGVVIVGTVAPWTVRNYQVLGAFVPVSTNGGVTLYSANNPWATGLAAPAPPLVGEVDEVSRDRLRSQAATAWIKAHPLQWIALMAPKATFTWGTSSTITSVVSSDRLPAWAEAASKAILNVAWSALFVLCALATWRGRPWTAGAGLFLSLLVFYIFGLHLAFEAQSRHHVPLIAALCLVAAQAARRGKDDET